MAAKEVDDHDAGFGQCLPAAAIEAAAVVHRSGGVLIVEVDLDHAEAAPVGRVADVVGGIADHDLQALVAYGQAEPLFGHRHHLRTDLDDGQGRVGQAAVAPARQRRRAQAQLQDGGRRPHEQQPGHHVTDVGQHQRLGPADRHRPLHPRRAEVQVADAVQLGEADDGARRLPPATLSHRRPAAARSCGGRNRPGRRACRHRPALPGRAAGWTSRRTGCPGPSGAAPAGDPG